VQTSVNSLLTYFDVAGHRKTHGSHKKKMSSGDRGGHFRGLSYKLCLHALNGNISLFSGPGNVVGIGTGYGLDGPGVESRWGRDFLHLSRPALGPTQPPVQCVPRFFRGKERPERDADPSPPSSAVVMKE
jgi:hypothetical protein